jgi:hypothetical protein
LGQFLDDRIHHIDGFWLFAELRASTEVEMSPGDRRDLLEQSSINHNSDFG